VTVELVTNYVTVELVTNYVTVELVTYYVTVFKLADHDMQHRLLFFFYPV